MPEILTFAWALLGRSVVIVGGVLLVLLVAYWERRLDSERHWEVYARLLLVSFAAAALLAGRDVSHEYARSGKHFSDGPLKSVIDRWVTGAASVEPSSPIGRFTIDETAAQRVDLHVPNPPAGRDAGAGTSQDVASHVFRSPSIAGHIRNGPPGSVEFLRQEPDLATGSDFKAHTSVSSGGLQLTEGLRADIREVRSRRNDMPYSVELTVRVADIVQPFGVVLTGAGVVDDLDFEVLGQAVYTMVLKGHIEGRPDQYYVGFDSPAVSPQTPVVITLRARQPIRIAKIERAYIPQG